MRALKDIESTRVVGLDIETTRITKHLSEAGEDIQTAWAYKNKNEGVIEEDIQLAELWELKASLYPEFSKVCSISLAFTNKEGTILNCMNFTSANELEVLTGLSDTIGRMVKSDPLYRFIAHAGLFFDYPFLAKRMIINGIPVPALLDSSHLKPWEVRNLDSNHLWKNGGTQGSSLVALCAALGLPISKNDMAGHEVGEYFYANKLTEIGTYCDLDTIAVFNCLRRFKSEPIFRFEDVNYIGQGKVEDEQIVAAVPQMACLNQLYLTKDFSEHIKEEIRDRFLNRGKKVMNKDFVSLEQMLCDLYINTEIMKSDKAPLVEEKKVEVNEFVEQLKKDYNASKKA